MCNRYANTISYRQYVEEFSENGRAISSPSTRFSTQYSVAMTCAAYLAMVFEFGYQVALTPTGLLLRRQYFVPHKFLRDMPLRCQMLLTAPSIDYADEHLKFWSEPFRFTIERGACFVAIKNIVTILPISRDPRLPIAKRLRIRPAKYTMRPDFSTVFD